MAPAPPAGGSPARSPSGRRVLKVEPDTIIWAEPGPRGEPRVVKRYRTRNPVTFLRRALTRFRAEREYLRLRHLERAGVSCTPPIGWAHGWSRDEGFHESLVMREVVGAVQLTDWVGRSHVAAAELAPLFRLVRRMHDAGLAHQVLYARNVLVVPDRPPRDRFVLADLPRAWVFPGTIVGTRPAWCDLWDLIQSLGEAGLIPEELPVEAYGRPVGDPGSATAGGSFSDRGTTPDLRSKSQRTRRDLAVRIRWSWAWFRAWLTRGPRRRPREGRRKDWT